MPELITPDTPPTPHADTINSTTGNRTGTPTDNPPGAAPRRPGRPKGSGRKKTVTSAQLREALGELLTAPAVPYSMMRQDWPAQHVLRTGQPLADAFVAYSETNPWFRDKLEALMRGENVLGVIVAVMALATALVEYVGPQLAYFGAIPVEIGERITKTPIPRPVAPSPPPGDDPGVNGADSAMSYQT